VGFGGPRLAVPAGGVILTAGGTQDRSSLWLPLLRQLTEACPDWVVWKNVESALFGIGDIDAAAPSMNWEVIEQTFRRWAAEHDLEPVVVCHHIPGGLNLISIPQGLPTFLEMGVKDRRIFRGSTLFVAGDLRPLMQMDPRGFRRIRPGAEGLLKLLLNGTRRGGGPNWEGIREKHVLELMREDPEGMRMAARLLGPAERALVAGAERAMNGGWNRAAMFMVDGWALLRGLKSPGVLVRRFQFRLRGKECPVVSAILTAHRRIPVDRESWLREVGLSHAL
jgi:hypothetical protein